MDTLKMKANKLPSWRPTVPGVQPRPTLHGVQPLITLRGLSAPTEHDLPIQRDTPNEVVESPFALPPIGAHRVPADLQRYLSDADLPDVPPTPPAHRGLVVRKSGPSDSGPSSTRRRFERAERVRRWGLGFAVALGTFALVVAGVVLFGSPRGGKHAFRPPLQVELPAANAPATGASEILPAPPVAELAPAPASSEPAPTLATSAAPALEQAGPTMAAVKKPLSPPAPPSRPSLFSQVPARPGVD